MFLDCIIVVNLYLNYYLYYGLFVTLSFVV